MPTRGRSLSPGVRTRLGAARGRSTAADDEQAHTPPRRTRGAQRWEQLVGRRVEIDGEVHVLKTFNAEAAGDYHAATRSVPPRPRPARKAKADALRSMSRASTPTAAATPPAAASVRSRGKRQRSPGHSVANDDDGSSASLPPTRAAKRAATARATTRTSARTRSRSPVSNPRVRTRSAIASALASAASTPPSPRKSPPPEADTVHAASPGEAAGVISHSDSDACVCEHVSSVNLEAAKPCVQDPERWVCEECDETSDTWVCLSCGHVGCGRELRGHALAHHHETDHELVFSLNQQSVYCYDCGDWVLGDNHRGDLEALRMLISFQQTHKFPPSLTRSGSVIHEAEDAWSSQSRRLRGTFPFARASTITRQQRQDRLFSAICHWRLLELASAFHMWQERVNIVPASTHTGAGAAEPSAAAQPATPPRLKRGMTSVGLALDDEAEEETAAAASAPLPPAAVDAAAAGVAAAASLPAKPPGANTLFGARLSALPRGRVGLRNLGNSCYMNAVLQALSNAPPFRDFFINLLPQHSALPVLNLPPPAALAASPPRPAARVRGGRSPGSTRGTPTKQRGTPTKQRGTPPQAQPAGVLVLSRVAPPSGRPLLVRQDTAACFESVKSMANKAKRPLEEMSLCIEMHNLMRVIWSGKWKAVSPYSLFFAIWRFMPAFRGHQQQDAQEFFNYLLETLHAELQGKPPDHIKSPSGSPELAPLATLLPRSNFVNQVFRGTVRTSVTCQRCRNESAREEPFLCLSLDIPTQFRTPTQSNATSRASRAARRSSGAAAPDSDDRDACTLDLCLSELVKPETLAGDSAYYCEQCRTSVQAVKQSALSVLPQLLVLHVNRAHWALHGCKSKVQTHVQFPLRDLDLRRYTSGGVQEEGQGGTRMEVDGEPEGSAAGGRTLYQLCSVVCHQGRGIDTGHWTSVCRDPEPGRDAWLRFNDIRVSIVPEEEVAASQASLLVYQRTGYVA